MADVPTVAWNENTPAGTDYRREGDDRICEMKTQLRQVIAVDHDFPSSGKDSDVGQHKQVTLQETTDVGTGDTGVPILGAQTSSEDKPELVYTDEDDNDVQLTNQGTPIPIQDASAKTTPVAADLLLLSDSADDNKSRKVSLTNLIGSLVYPVGSYYFNDSVSTNPGTLLGFGTWVAVEERVLVGYKSGSSEFGTAGGQGGEKTHTLSKSEVPAVTPTISACNNQSGAGNVNAAVKAQASNATITGTTDGGGEAHNNLQPYRTVYMWRRTA